MASLMHGEKAGRVVSSPPPAMHRSRDSCSVQQVTLHSTHILMKAAADTASILCHLQPCVDQHHAQMMTQHGVSAIVMVIVL